MKAAAILRRAAGLVDGPRQKTHGDMRRNHENIAAFWTVWLERRGLLRDGARLDAVDAAQLLSLLKKARTLTGDHNGDDYGDDSGYVGIAGQLASSQKRHARARFILDRQRRQ
jgi:hypothetical protein